MEINNMAKNLAGLISENSPTILSSLAVAGLISTAVLAVKATPKALSLLEDELEHGRVSPDIRYLPGFFSKRDIIRITWKCYVPAAIVGSASIICIVQANSINQRRIAAVAGAYTIAERALSEYQSKVVETIGRTKELKIRDEIASDRVKENPPSAGQVIITGDGNVLCYDTQTGRYFRSSIEKIRQSVNVLNKGLLTDMFVSLNELYFALGLDGVKLGDDLGWHADKFLIDITFSSQLTPDGEPCLVINYDVAPRRIK
jgi:hypothetical protein